MFESRRHSGSVKRSPLRVNVGGVRSSSADGGGALRVGKRKVMRGGEGVCASFSDLTDCLMRGREVEDGVDADPGRNLEEIFGDDVRFASAVSASGGLYMELGRRKRFPGPVSCALVTELLASAECSAFESPVSVDIGVEESGCDNSAFTCG